MKVCLLITLILFMLFSVVTAQDPPSKQPEPPPTYSHLQYSRADVEQTINKMKDPDENVRGTALMSLPTNPGHFEREPELLTELVIPALVEMIQTDPSNQNRGTAVSLLCGMKEKAAPAVPALIKALNDDKTRQYVATWIHEIGAPAKPAVPRLTDLLIDSDKAARADAARGLSGFGPLAAEAVPALIEALPALKELAKTGPGVIR
jgi:hypothetical protein